MVVLFFWYAAPMLTGCWQQAAAESRTAIEGDLSMMILWELGSYQPLWRLQTWMLERLISAQLNSPDLRSSVVALALNVMAAVWAAGRRRFVPSRASEASRSRNPADSMVAAAFR
jgi:hypothetical protein